MRALSQEQVIQLIEDYKEYGTLREVSRINNVSPNTVKKYAFQEMIVKTQNIVNRVCSNDECLIGTYIGIWLGDGTQYFDRGYTVKICCNKDDKYLNKFIQDIIYKLFGKSTALIKEPLTKQAYIKFRSKFIFTFIKDYVVFDEKKKTYTVKLKKRAGCYNTSFLEGCLLGLTLSDGYLKTTFSFNVVSSRLAKNMHDILKKFRYNPYHYVHKREKYGWKDLYMVRLNTKDSKRLKLLLDGIIKKLGYSYPFDYLKYGLDQT